MYIGWRTLKNFIQRYFRNGYDHWKTGNSNRIFDTTLFHENQFFHIGFQKFPVIRDFLHIRNTGGDFVFAKFQGNFFRNLYISVFGIVQSCFFTTGIEKFKDAIAVSGLPMIVSVPEVSLDKILELLSKENICGISGYAINENAKELLAIKKLFL